MDINDSESSSIDDKTLVAGVDTNPKTIEINLIGKCLKERYVIESKLGSGGMSDIYRAKDLKLESAGVAEPYVAIKVLLQQFSATPEAKQVLVKEAHQTQQLSHPNIIRVYDVDSQDNFHFIIMEWLDGETLEQVIKRSKPLGIPFKGAYKIAEQIANALSYAHNLGIVHTDLKPSNIILTRKGDIKVFDFGVAQSFQLNIDKYALQNHEQLSPLSGYTPAYASYEQLKDKPPCVADDVYAFSCIVYELLSSKHPYQRITADKVDIKSTHLAKPSNLSWYLWPSLKKGLALHKAERSKNINEILNGLSKQLWPKLAISAVGAVAIFVFVQTYLVKQKTIDDLSAQIALAAKYDKERKAFEALSSSEVLSTLESIPSEYKLFKQGLLREHRTDIIDVVEKRIMNVPNKTNSVYKNYGQIEIIINDALAIFPDSFRLQQLQNEIQINRQATTDALSGRLNLLLTQGRYGEAGDNDIEAIIQDLLYINPYFKFQPNIDAFNLYRTNFDAAVNVHDASKISELIKVGELAFNHYEDAEPLLIFGKKMEASVNSIANFKKNIIEGKNPTYPYEAAKFFYKTTFDEFNDKFTDITTYKELEILDESVMRLAAQIPKGFEPLIAIEKKLAASYLSFANISMEKKQFKTAQKLVKRGNELYKMFD
ncbi:serine/threonine-protein kinase [Colwellia sp. UCD-KL20]|uniref:serine/threonine-protein kinase n=1 Tax=Colwellia sp. UCD-KL20 TaxID=1917165 RepID=UPI000970D84E|nr:serine/threonine-protein kinase [Colwellia sp. UCD-KL20]